MIIINQSSTIIFPTFFPFNKPRKASGTLSIPLKTVSLGFSFYYEYNPTNSLVPSAHCDNQLDAINPSILRLFPIIYIKFLLPYLYS